MQQYIDVLLRVRVEHNETIDAEEVGSELDITVNGDTVSDLPEAAWVTYSD